MAIVLRSGYVATAGQQRETASAREILIDDIGIAPVGTKDNELDEAVKNRLVDVSDIAFSVSVEKPPA